MLHTTWAATRLHLVSIRQEYNAISQELAATTDLERRAQLLRWKIACRQEFQRVLQEWRDHNTGSNGL
jgi:hypothetical protein